MTLISFVKSDSSNDKNHKTNVDRALQANLPNLSPSSPDTVTSQTSRTSLPSPTKYNTNTMTSLTGFSLEIKGNDQNGDGIKNDHREDEMKEIELKTDEICSCLGGVYIQKDSSSKSRKSRRGRDKDASNTGDDDDDDDEKVVDLWHLRQLAISKHGFVSASIRKRAWLKLVHADEHIFTSSSASLPSHFSKTTTPDRKSNTNVCKVNELQESDIPMIKNDIQNCVWKVKDEIKLIRKHKSQERVNKEKNGLNFKKESLDDSSLASLDSGCSSITAGRITPQLIPEAIRAFPRFGTGVPSPNASGASTPVSGVGTPNLYPSITPIGIQNMSINENSNIPTVIKKTSRKESSKSRRRRKEEHAILLNIITSILRTAPEKDSIEHDSDLESDADADTVVADNINKLYYFRGMHNVIAPLLITLESPSLTSLVFNRLSQNHFYDAMGPTFKNIQAAIRLIFIPLLEKVDSSLHNYIVKDAGIKDPCIFALPWVLGWFTGEIANYDIVARLFDVFISSHASFPVYLSVAILTHPSNRRRIMMTPCDESSLTSVIGSLPSTTAAETNAMDAFEDIIEIALSYMSLIPIQEILSLCKINQDGLVKDSMQLTGSVKMIKKPASWAYTLTAPTDWSLIKQSKLMRDLSPTSRLEKKKAFMAKKKSSYCHHSTVFVYEMALDASGLSSKFKDSIRKPAKTSRHVLHFVILFLVTIGLLTLAINKESMMGIEDIAVEETELKYEVKHQIETIVKDIHVRESHLDIQKEPEDKVYTRDEKVNVQKQEGYNGTIVFNEANVKMDEDGGGEEKLQKYPLSTQERQDHSKDFVINGGCDNDIQEKPISIEKQEDHSGVIVTDYDTVKQEGDDDDIQKQSASIEKQEDWSEVVVSNQATRKEDGDDVDMQKDPTSIEKQEKQSESIVPKESDAERGENDKGNEVQRNEDPIRGSGLKATFKKFSTKIEDSDLLFIFEYVIPNESDSSNESNKAIRSDGSTQRSGLKSALTKISKQIQRIDQYLQKDSDLLFILE